MDDKDIDLIITKLELFVKTYNLSIDININNTINKIKNIKKNNDRYKFELLQKSIDTIEK